MTPAMFADAADGPATTTTELLIGFASWFPYAGTALSHRSDAAVGDDDSQPQGLQRKQSDGSVERTSGKRETGLQAPSGDARIELTYRVAIGT